MTSASAYSFSMSIQSDDVVDLYQRHAGPWVRARLLENTLYEKPWLDRFCALLPAGASVLDCGCGAGEPVARYLSGCGHEVMGVDSSKEMVRMFRTRLPEQRAAVVDMRTLELPETFNGILAWDSFFHLPPSDQRKMFSVFRNHAAARAALMFTSGPSHGEVIGKLEGEPLYHASLDPAEYRGLLGDHGFEVMHHISEDPSCFGRTVWLAAVAIAVRWITSPSRLPQKSLFAETSPVRTIWRSRDFRKRRFYGAFEAAV